MDIDRVSEKVIVTKGLVLHHLEGLSRHLDARDA